MLVLGRKLLESIWIGDKIKVTIVKIEDGYVRVGIEAPKELNVVREELLYRDGQSDNRGNKS